MQHYEIGTMGEYFTPGEILDKIVALDNYIRSLVVAARGAKLSDAIRAQFQDFAREWAEWKNRNSGWVSRALNSTRDALRTYTARAQHYAALIGGAGATVPPDPFRFGQMSPLGTALPWLVIGGGAFALWRLLRGDR